MRASDLRKTARDVMANGNYWYLFLANIVLAVITGLLGITWVGLLLIGPFQVGLNYYYLKVARNGKTEIVEFFKPVTSNFMNGFVLGILKMVFIFLWSLLFVIPGLIKTYSYGMAEYLMADDDQLSGNDAITKSREIMSGHKFRLFCLHLSFIGWYLLGILTLGIGLIFIMPYVKAAETAFYQDLIKDSIKTDAYEVNPDDYEIEFN